MSDIVTDLIEEAVNDPEKLEVLIRLAYQRGRQDATKELSDLQGHYIQMYNSLTAISNYIVGCDGKCSGKAVELAKRAANQAKRI